MIDEIAKLNDVSRGATLGRLRQDLVRCIARSEALGLTAIAIYLQRAVDEIGQISG